MTVRICVYIYIYMRYIGMILGLYYERIHMYIYIGYISYVIIEH